MSKHEDRITALAVCMHVEQTMRSVSPVSKARPGLTWREAVLAVMYFGTVIGLLYIIWSTS